MKPPRFLLINHKGCGHCSYAEMVMDPNGPLIGYAWFEQLEAENARLEGEVERLTKAHSDALADFWAIHKGYFDLKAEVERLRYLEGVASSVDFYQQENEKLNKEIERLEMLKDACKRMIRRRDKWICERRADVERLRKAGDVMAKNLDWTDAYAVKESIEAEKAWNAAKEGKQP